MFQEAGAPGIPKFCFFLKHHFHVWNKLEWLAMPQHSESSTQGSMGSYSHCPGIPTSYSPARGDQVLAFCTPQDWTENLTVNSPTLQPLTHSGWWFFVSNVSIYCPGCPRTSRKFKNQKFKFCKYRDSNPVPRRCLCRTNALTAWPQAP